MCSVHFLFLLTLLATYDKLVCAARRTFDFKLLNNPGLTSPIAASSRQDCIDQCASKPQCSAISYQHSSSTCIHSYCANLQMVTNNGWNTYVLSDDMMIEGKDFPTPQLEWMLTDNCGLTATGNITTAPPMAPGGVVGYNASMSSIQGNALWMDGNAGTYCRSVPSSVLNMNYYTYGFTMSGWYYLERASTQILLFEFGVSTNPANEYSYGTYFWVFSGGLNCKVADDGWPTNYHAKYNYVAPVGVWFHAALTYDPTIAGMSIYLNGTLMGTYIGSAMTAHANWNIVGVGSRQSLGNLPGRLYCIRFFTQALMSDQIAAIAKSCQVGRLRFL